jgi:hypothetical protein
MVSRYLVLREVAIRMKAGVVSLVVLGIIYGMYNEGLIAKTFLRAYGVPVNTFDGYGLYGGVETGWAMAISTWHAFFAFLFPIVIVYSLYPGKREARWLNGTVLTALTGVTLLISGLVFFRKDDHGITGTPAQYLAMVAASVLLVLLATRFSKIGSITPEEPRSLTPAIAGFCMHLAVILVPAVLAAAKTPIVLYVAYFGVLTWYFFRRVFQKGGIALGSLRRFAFGGEIAVALFALVRAYKHNSLESVVSSSVFIVGLGYLLFKW